MKIVFETTENHDTDEYGAALADHCCGCWNVYLAADNPLVPYAVCNECGAIRKFRAVGIRSPLDRPEDRRGQLRLVEDEPK